MERQITLGDVIVPAKVLRCDNDDYPVLSMTMHDGIVLQSNRFKKSLASIDQSNYKVVLRGQLVVGFPIDEGVIYVQNIAEAGIMSPAYGVWNIHSKEIMPEYLELCLHSPQSMDYYKNKLRGTTARRRSITTGDLLALPIILPSLTEQKRRIGLFRQTTLLLNSQKQAMLKFDELVKSRFVEIFGDPVTNSKGYPIHQLSDHILFLTSGSRGWAQYYTDKGEWFITIKNVKDCRISVDDVQCINPPKNAEAERTRLREGDLLISITADLGRTGVVTKEIAEHGAYNNQHLTCIRLDRLALDPLYAAFFMESEAGKRQFEAKNMSAVKAGLNFDSIRSLRLIVPPLALQKEFTAFVAEVDKSKLAVKQSLEKLETLKKSLMQKYFG